MITIVCDQHLRPHFITRFVRGVEGWEESAPPSARQVRSAMERRAEPLPDDATDLEKWLHDATPSGRMGQKVNLTDDQPMSTYQKLRRHQEHSPLKALEAMQSAVKGEPIPAPEPLPVDRDVYPNRCDRCAANQPRRKENMDPLLDLLTSIGRDQVTLRELAAIAREYDERTPTQ